MVFILYRIYSTDKKNQRIPITEQLGTEQFLIVESGDTYLIHSWVRVPELCTALVDYLFLFPTMFDREALKKVAQELIAAYFVVLVAFATK